MNRIFFFFYISMKKLCLELMKYREGDPHYQQILSVLAQQYQAFNILMALNQDKTNNIYYFKYADMGNIKSLLTNTCYLEQPTKPKNR